MVAVTVSVLAMLLNAQPDAGRLREYGRNSDVTVACRIWRLARPDE
jgi:hypothetical protein